MWTRSRKVLGFVFVLLLATSALAQSEAGTWQRVYTGEDSVIDFNTSSLQFDEKQVLRMKIRTVLKSLETLRDDPQIKVKTRVETIEFNLLQKVYRLTEVVMFDSSGKTVRTFPVNSTEWKPIKAGGMMDRLYFGARSYLPFGSWKVVSYRLVEATNLKPEELRDFERLIGVPVTFEATYAKVDEELCRIPSYKSVRFSLPELSRQLGSDVKVPEIKSDSVEILNISCEGAGWAPRTSLLVKLSESSMLMLWKGVFLTLKRD
jgi:hypothetical protein